MGAGDRGFKSRCPDHRVHIRTIYKQFHVPFFLHILNLWEFGTFTTVRYEQSGRSRGAESPAPAKVAPLCHDLSCRPVASTLANAFADTPTTPSCSFSPAFPACVPESSAVLRPAVVSRASTGDRRSDSAEQWPRAWRYLKARWRSGGGPDRRPPRSAGPYGPPARNRS